MPDTVQSAKNPGTPERRSHPRKQLWFPSLQLGDDNGGFILNISERGLAMTVVRSLPDDPAPHMRFQISQSNAWVETGGRIAWVSASKTTAGVEFVGLPYEGRIRIKNWISSLQSSASVKKSTPDENTALKPLSPTLGPESGVSVPEPETAGSVIEDQNQPVTARDPAGVLPNLGETRGAETVSECSAAESTTVRRTEISQGGAEGDRGRLLLDEFSKFFGGAQISLMDDAGFAVTAGTIDEVVVEAIASFLFDEADHHL
jgi:hypothetical protein